ncbi:succinate dehydrogenase, cytochrome b556 subunit [Celerinatantimonas diazotrophica]|uniref:Succinate dehydrogenase cytochrome b556 subunit n=1 Tax=Celerinatantimonas diazotrophica TaxID=412034 RepID=A0A4R1J7S2_9GAMM|nr:succinate dehydrogenase, cytochrome b556 subunit [Celerinatantimonas diazotrophica]TCK46581.1 succinate dehydrogenase subunit C [Celerinatantimonas diazotrophica]CAG9296631.1 Succinate dehydrogenase cytochrome b556 subunit [Celerinatantimonas diazotrophica]
MFLLDNGHKWINIVNKQSRPVNLQLQSIRLPVNAVASILHRISGVVIFFALAILLSLLAKSLGSADGFAMVASWFDSFFVKLIIWLISAVFCYHLVFGIRHMIMDCGYWEELASANSSARICLIVALVLVILMGIIIW